MSKHTSKPVALTAALVGGLALSSSAFAMSDLSAGYMLGAQHAEQADKAAEGKCGEGKCGSAGHDMEAMDSDGDGSISETEFAAAHDGDASRFAQYDTDSDGMINADELKAAHEGKCGEGKCGEGKCGEGKCGEGKCGGDSAATGAADADAGVEAAAKSDMEGKCGEGKCGGSA